jgi:hypothetical protein
MDMFMTTTSPFLKIVYEGWESHQQALLHAVTPLTSNNWHGTSHPINAW